MKVLQGKIRGLSSGENRNVTVSYRLRTLQLLFIGIADGDFSHLCNISNLRIVPVHPVEEPIHVRIVKIAVEKKDGKRDVR